MSGPERPCTHDDRHPHGNRVRYVIDKCRCRPCRDSAAAYTRDLARRHLYGKVTYVNADPARAHVQSLQEQGMGWKRIARQAGIDTSILWKLLYGDSTRNMSPSKRIRPATEAKILAVTLDLAGGAKIDSTGTARRIQALVAIGWSQSKIAARLGILRSNFTTLAQGGTPVTVARAKAVADLYDQLWDQTPPHIEWRDHIAYSCAINYAVAYNWFVPLAWDDEDIDNPDAQPDLGQDTRVPSGGRIHLEDVEFLIGTGLTLSQVTHRLGVKRDAIEHSCARADRRDLLAAMMRNKIVQENAA